MPGFSLSRHVTAEERTSVLAIRLDGLRRGYGCPKKAKAGRYERTHLHAKPGTTREFVIQKCGPHNPLFDANRRYTPASTLDFPPFQRY